MMSIKEIEIVDPALTNGQLKIGCLRGMDENFFNRLAQKWTGYGEYEIFKQ
jgi:hypothetical protein